MVKQIGVYMEKGARTEGTYVYCIQSSVQSGDIFTHSYINDVVDALLSFAVLVNDFVENVYYYYHCAPRICYGQE